MLVINEKPLSFIFIKFSQVKFKQRFLIPHAVQIGAEKSVESEESADVSVSTLDNQGQESHLLMTPIVFAETRGRFCMVVLINLKVRQNVCLREIDLFSGWPNFHDEVFRKCAESVPKVCHLSCHAALSCLMAPCKVSG